MKLGFFAGIGIAALALGIASCGGGGDDALTPEAYFEQLAPIGQDLLRSFNEAESEFLGGLETATTAEEGRPVFAAYFDDLQAVFEQFRDDLDALEPPAEASDAHNAALDTADDVLMSVDEAVEQLAAAEGSGEIAATVETSSTHFDDVTDTCRALQDVADEEGVDVDLGCEGAFVPLN